MRLFPSVTAKSRSASARRCRRSAPAFTLLELLVTVVIIAIVAALSLPVMGKMRQASRRAGCLVSLVRLASPANAYQVDHRGFLPPRYADVKRCYVSYFEPYIVKGERFLCPEASEPIDWKKTMGDVKNAWYDPHTGIHGSYGLCYSLASGVSGGPLASSVSFKAPVYNLPKAVQRSRTPMFVDCLWPGFSGTKEEWGEQARVPFERHGGGASVLFVDGSAAFFKKKEIRYLQWANDYSPPNE